MTKKITLLLSLFGLSTLAGMLVGKLINIPISLFTGIPLGDNPQYWMYVIPMWFVLFYSIIFKRGRPKVVYLTPDQEAKVTIIAVTLDELEGVKKILPQIKKEWYDQLIVLDGNSTDGTLEWCKREGYETYTQKRKGVWYAYKELFESDLISGDVVVTLSPDGNSIPEAIPELVKKMREGYDMVIASRYFNGAHSDDDTFLTGIGNKIFTFMCSLFGHYNYSDAMVIYRAYRANLAKELGFTNELNSFQERLARASNLYGWESSMSIRAGKARMRIVEIGADEPKAFRERRQSTFGHGLILLGQILHEGLFRRSNASR